jgi:hypothetical protein
MICLSSPQPLSSLHQIHCYVVGPRKPRNPEKTWDRKQTLQRRWLGKDLETKIFIYIYIF